jgi:hypothetical protein
VIIIITLSDLLSDTHPYGALTNTENVITSLSHMQPSFRIKLLSGKLPIHIGKAVIMYHVLMRRHFHAFMYPDETQSTQ